MKTIINNPWGGLRIGSSIVTNVGIGDSIVFALEAYPCVSKHNLKPITLEQYKSLPYYEYNSGVFESVLYLSKPIETLKYRMYVNESISDFKDCPVGSTVSSGIAFDHITNNGDHLLLSGMACPKGTLDNLKDDSFSKLGYEFVINGISYKYIIFEKN